MRVWELRQHFCLAIGSEAYFAWQLLNDQRLLQDHYFVANVTKCKDTEISFQAIKRRLRPPTLDERVYILYYVSICHRRKLWKLVSKSIQLQSTTGRSDRICTRICTIVRAIEANYAEMSENYSFPDTVQHCYGPNVILTNVVQTNAFLSAKRYGPAMTVPLSNC